MKHPYPDHAYLERDSETNEKRWFSSKGMGVRYVHEDQAAEDVAAAVAAERERCAEIAKARMMDEKTRDGIAAWLKSRGISVTAKFSDKDVVDALWQEVCDALYLHENGNPKFSDDGTLLDKNGKRSVLDDVDV